MADVIINPEIGANGSIGKTKTTVPNTVPNATTTAQQTKVAAPTDTVEQYTEIKKVTIALVKNYSLFRRANDKVLPRRVDYIGSSVTSSRVLASNKQEVETYFPNLIGLSPNDSNFVREVKKYLNNIRVAVDEIGLELNASFHYYDKRSYLEIQKQEEEIETNYSKVNRNDITAIKEALNEKITLLNALESQKCTLGYPIDVEQYLIYRHCLLYKDVAKDIALINSDSSIRFYIKDNKREEEKLKSFRNQILLAKKNYVEAMADTNLFDAIYVQYCVLNNLPVIASLAEDRVQREIKLDRFSQDEPAKFNKIFNNKEIKTIANIEKLIAYGLLIRSQFNQQISTTEGVVLGANMTETLAWFKNPENTQTVQVLLNQLKNI